MKGGEWPAAKFFPRQDEPYTTMARPFKNFFSQTQPADTGGLPPLSQNGPFPMVWPYFLGCKHQPPPPIVPTPASKSSRLNNSSTQDDGDMDGNSLFNGRDTSAEEDRRLPFSEWLNCPVLDRRFGSGCDGSRSR